MPQRAETSNPPPCSEQQPVTIGIDVSKDHLDVAIHPGNSSARFTNDSDGIKSLRQWIGKRPVRLVVFEATGPYHREMERRLTQSGFACAKINPRQARRFAEATGKLAKTDPVDAAMPARFGALLEPEARPVRDETRETLTELVAARRNLVADHTATLNRMETRSHDLLKQQAEKRLEQIKADIAAIDAAIANLIASNPVLARQHAILVSIPGIGNVTSHALLADMPELGTMDEKQAAALAGVAPITRQSGKWSGKSFIQGGAGDGQASVIHAEHGGDALQSRSCRGLSGSHRTRQTRQDRHHRRDAKACCSGQRLDP
jgi:transposase